MLRTMLRGFEDFTILIGFFGYFYFQLDFVILFCARGNADICERQFHP